jgi:hypothetical protein
VSDLLSTDKHGAELTGLEIRSEAVGETLPVNVVVPEGADADENRPLLVFLHGRADDGDGEDSSLNDEMYAALADQGDRAPIVAFPSGGEASYWHDRADGEWESWVTEEVIPRVAKEFDADPNGWRSEGSRWVAMGHSTSPESIQGASGRSEDTRPRCGRQRVTRPRERSTMPRTCRP